MLEFKKPDEEFGGVNPAIKKTHKDAPDIILLMPGFNESDNLLSGKDINKIRLLLKRIRFFKDKFYFYYYDRMDSVLCCDLTWQIECGTPESSEYMDFD